MTGKAGHTALLGFWLTLILSCGQSAPATAKAMLVNAQGRKVGNAALTETPQGVRIVLRAENLPPGEYALRIHEKGVCAAPYFQSAGGYFKPDQTLPGQKNPVGPHTGDLPNITVGPDGQAAVEVVVSVVTLKEGRPNSLLQPGGTALVLHAGPDAKVSGSAGNAGPRIACGVITR